MNKSELSVSPGSSLSLLSDHVHIPAISLLYMDTSSSSSWPAGWFPLLSPALIPSPSISYATHISKKRNKVSWDEQTRQLLEDEMEFMWIKETMATFMLSALGYISFRSFNFFSAALNQGLTGRRAWHPHTRRKQPRKKFAHLFSLHHHHRSISTPWWDSSPQAITIQRSHVSLDAPSHFPNSAINKPLRHTEVLLCMSEFVCEKH